MQRKDKNEEFLSRLYDECIQDILITSDDEIVREAKEEGNFKEVVSKLRSNITKLIKKNRNTSKRRVS